MRVHRAAFPWAGPVRVGLFVIGAGFLFGALTAYGQGLLPDQLRSAANSAGVWAASCFALPLLGRTWRVAAAFGFMSLASELFGYAVSNELRGFPSSTGTLVFWMAAAFVAGPLLGVGAYWTRFGADSRVALGSGGLSGVLVGEGIYGVWHIGDTTSPAYWSAQIVIGVAVLGFGPALRGSKVRLYSVPVAAAVAVAFVGAYANASRVISVVP